MKILSTKLFFEVYKLDGKKKNSFISSLVLRAHQFYHETVITNVEVLILNMYMILPQHCWLFTHRIHFPVEAN